MEDTKMETTKITVKLYEPLLDNFTKQMESAFLKRDAFLNHVIRGELAYLEREMTGLRQSSVARLHVSRSLKRLGTKTVNITVDKEVAARLKAVVEESNMVRDAFLNRLIMLLRSTDEVLDFFQVPLEVNSSGLRDAPGLSTSPLTAIEQIIGDPLSYLRTVAQQHGPGDLYLRELPAKMAGLCCYLEDKRVPGTKEFDLEARDRLVSLDGPDALPESSREVTDRV